MRQAVNLRYVGSIPALPAMNDNDFINKLVKEKTIKWIDNYPWSGFQILNTCLILRQHERGVYNEEARRHEFQWYISTYAFTIVVKTIDEGNLSKDWPKDMAELDKYGLKLNEDFRNTPDF